MLPEVLTSGTAAQWVAAFVLLGIFVKQIIPWRKLSLDAESALRKEVKELVDRVAKCERECEDHKRELHEKMFSMRKQHIQEQISFASAIIESVPSSPQLKILLNAMERGERTLKLEMVGGPVADAETGPK